jgi:hypothetical protein
MKGRHAPRDTLAVIVLTRLATARTINDHVKVDANALSGIALR